MNYRDDSLNGSRKESRCAAGLPPKKAKPAQEHGMNELSFFRHSSASTRAGMYDRPRPGFWGEANVILSVSLSGGRERTHSAIADK